MCKTQTAKSPGSTRMPIKILWALDISIDVRDILLCKRDTHGATPWCKRTTPSPLDRKLHVGQLQRGPLGPQSGSKFTRPGWIRVGLLPI